MAKTNCDTRIAGVATIKDWKKLRNTLHVANELTDEQKKLWNKAYFYFLRQRLRTRYLFPISILSEIKKNEGEGFTIVSIQCAMIEFLAALRLGIAYQYNKPDRKEWQYNNSKAQFTAFFSNFLHSGESCEESSDLFNDWRNNVGKWQGGLTDHANTCKTCRDALSFYSNIRCGLLHEARTTGGWKIRANGKTAIDWDQKIVYRNRLQQLIEEYLAQYRADLLTNKELQKAFIHKFNHLCDLDIHEGCPEDCQTPQT